MTHDAASPSADHGSAAPDAVSGPAHRYDARLAETIETRWQQRWAEAGVNRVPNPGEEGFDPGRRKLYLLDMFPYPSGAGLHVGHPLGYLATDILGRYRRMRGDAVLHPMGWDAFGLPAEQYALQTGVHPAKTTRSAIDNFRRQLRRIGFSFDWSREIATIDPGYYRWTQWIWLQAYESWYDAEQGRARPIAELEAAFRAGERPIRCDPEMPRGLVCSIDPEATFESWDGLDRSTRRRVLASYRLAYLAEQTVNWCPKLGTALANEEVIDGRSERGGHPVHRTPLRQWMFRITAFADRLLEDLEPLDWPSSTRAMQEAWIGRSEGAEVDFPLEDGAGAIRVYTTRPDTMFGATFMVLAPEHPLVERVLADPPPGCDAEAVRAYVRAAVDRAEVDRLADTGEKTGVPLGVHAVNPATGEPVPVWIADYVLIGYGHGAIMAVPAHDDRDFEFARAFGLPIRDVVHSRVQAAILAFAERRGRASDDPEGRRRQLADFVGLEVTEARMDHDEVMRIVLERRAGGAAGEPVEREPRRGSIALVWRETLDELAGGDHDALLADALAGRLSERSGSAGTDPGFAARSSNDEVSLDGLPTGQAKARMIDWLEASERGRRTVNFKLRDWLFSRQRYWGEPFPVVFDEHGDHYAVSTDALPVTLPDVADYTPIESDEPVPLLAKATDWVRTTAGEAGVPGDHLEADAAVHRETNTMPGWAGSCWYYLRYCDPANDERLVGPDAERYWMLSRRDGAPVGPEETFDPALHHIGGVDMYIGGAEHAVLHLLYARFWHKILFDLGHVSTPEPFGRLRHQGLITAFAYARPDESLVPSDEVEEREDGSAVEAATGEPVVQVKAKMSKSLKNVVNPDDVIREYGADSLRLYEMYMGPLEATKPWNPRDIVGVHRFLQRLWRLVVDEQTGALVLRESADESVEKALHRTTAKVGEDIERLSFNTAIAALIELVNAATAAGGITADQAGRLARLLWPFAPHVASEVTERIGADAMLADAPWPAVDESMLRDETIEIVVQVLGKVRSRIEVAADADRETIEAAALADERIRELIEGRTVRKVIVVPGKLVNIVV